MAESKGRTDGRGRARASLVAISCLKCRAINLHQPPSNLDEPVQSPPLLHASRLAPILIGPWVLHPSVSTAWASEDGPLAVCCDLASSASSCLFTLSLQPCDPGRPLTCSGTLARPAPMAPVLFTSAMPGPSTQSGLGGEHMLAVPGRLPTLLLEVPQRQWTGRTSGRAKGGHGSGNLCFARREEQGVPGGAATIVLSACPPFGCPAFGCPGCSRCALFVPHRASSERGGSQAVICDEIKCDKSRRPVGQSMNKSHSPYL